MTGQRKRWLEHPKEEDSESMAMIIARKTEEQWLTMKKMDWIWREKFRERERDARDVRKKKMESGSVVGYENYKILRY